MTVDPPPVPDGPPIPEVVYSPAEATAWIRTMAPGALVRAARRHPKRFPSVKPGRDRGFTGRNILAILAGLEGESEDIPGVGRPRRATPTRTAEPGVTPILKAAPERALGGRKSA